MVVMLHLYPDKPHLHHGKAQSHETTSPGPGVVQLVRLPQHHLPQGGAHAGRRQPGRQPLPGCRAVNDYPHFAEVGLSLRAATGDPGRLAQTELTPDLQGVRRFFAAAVRVVVL